MPATLHRILLVEDNADIRAVVKLALEKLGGFEVRACASGAEGLDALPDFQPQLVLLDVMMPDMDGPGMLERLRERPEAAGIPVVFLTAKTSSAEVQRLRDLGALDVLAKPFNPATLHVRVRTLWEGAGA
ncbi:MAG: response regulator [Burkholderiales bacterium]|nr:response regulator [Burkholderiales bacterium]